MKNFSKILFVACVLFLSIFYFGNVSIALAAYPAFSPNSDLVIVGPYDTVFEHGGGNWGCTSACTSGGFREFITIGKKYRIRQNGTIDRIKLYTISTTSLTGFYLTIWRKDGSTYDLVGTSNNLATSLVAGAYSVIDLSTPITGVQEGDYYGYRVEASDSTYHFRAKGGISGVTSYYVSNSTPSASDYNWEGATAVSGSVFLINLYMQAPQVVFIGDSIIAGHPSHYSFVETAGDTNIISAIEGQFSLLTGYSYQNMGIGGEKTSQILSRFTSDVINLKPRVAVIEGGRK